jgi:hypothetical protein
MSYLYFVLGNNKSTKITIKKWRLKMKTVTINIQVKEKEEEKIILNIGETLNTEEEKVYEGCGSHNLGTDERGSILSEVRIEGISDEYDDKIEKTIIDFFENHDCDYDYSVYKRQIFFTYIEYPYPKEDWRKITDIDVLIKDIKDISTLDEINCEFTFYEWKVKSDETIKY